MTNENQEKQSSDNLGEILKVLSLDQIRFITARQEFSTDKEAAEAIGLKPNTISQWKHSGVPIDEACALMAFDGLETALHIRRRNLVKAMLVKIAGLDSEDESLRQKVATELIEWETGKATQKAEIGGKIEIGDGLTDEQRLARTMAILDAARKRRDSQTD